MIYLVVLLSILNIISLIYIFGLRGQISKMNRLLEKRFYKKTNQVVSLQLFDSKLNQLASNINKCLKAEENLRLKVVHEEDRFKEMIANISHDFRTPLTAIRGYLQLIQKGFLSEEQQNKIWIVDQHAMELGKLIDSFYEYAYLLNAEPNMKIERIQLSSLVTECFAGAVPEIEAHGLDFELLDRTVWVQADKQMTLRVIQNLVRNCLTHARKKISVWYEVGDVVTLHVSNYVEVDDKVDVNRIFERFYVSDGARNSTGLGLSIVKMLVEQMGGEAGAILKEGQLDIWVTFNEVSSNPL